MNSGPITWLSCVLRIAMVVAFVACNSVGWTADDPDADVVIREIQKASKQAASVNDLIDLSNRALQATEEYVKRDNFQLATRAVNLAVELVSRSNNKHLMARAKTRKDEVALINKEYKSLAKLIKKLETDLDNAEANRKLALYRAGFKKEWTESGDMLKKSGDPLLIRIADAEATSPLENAARIKLAEDWTKAAEQETGALRTRLQQRAYHWYQAAYLQSNGDQRVEIDRALADMPFRYLTDMDEKEVGVGAFTLGKYGLNRDKGDPIVLDGVAYKLGIGMAPRHNKPFSVTYNLGGKYKTLSLGCGLNGTVREYLGELRFYAFGDGRLLWKSPGIKTQADAGFFTVNVKNVQTLELRTECLNSGDGSHSVWLDPVLAK